VIRQKADKAREQLRQMDEYLASIEANPNYLPKQHDLPPLPHPNPPPLHPNPPPPPPPCFHQIYPEYIPLVIQQHHRNQPPPIPYDPKSPLIQILQTKNWPLEYKPHNLPRYDGSIDPRQFVMSYEAAVAAAGGDEYTIAKSFIIIARDIAQSWYGNHPLGSIES